MCARLCAVCVLSIASARCSLTRCVRSSDEEAAGDTFDDGGGGGGGGGGVPVRRTRGKMSAAAARRLQAEWKRQARPWAGWLHCVP